MSGDAGELGEEEDRHYRSILEANAAELVERIHPSDVVILHDPQTAGLASPLVTRVRALYGVATSGRTGPTLTRRGLEVFVAAPGQVPT